MTFLCCIVSCKTTGFSFVFKLGSNGYCMICVIVSCLRSFGCISSIISAILQSEFIIWAVYHLPHSLNYVWKSCRSSFWQKPEHKLLSYSASVTLCWVPGCAASEDLPNLGAVFEEAGCSKCFKSWAAVHVVLLFISPSLSVKFSRSWAMAFKMSLNPFSPGPISHRTASQLWMEWADTWGGVSWLWVPHHRLYFL